MKIGKKASSLVLETLDPFLKMLATRLVNLLSKGQDVQIFLYIFIVFS